MEITILQVRPSQKEEGRAKCRRRICEKASHGRSIPRKTNEGLLRNPAKDLLCQGQERRPLQEPQERLLSSNGKVKEYASNMVKSHAIFVKRSRNNEDAF